MGNFREIVGRRLVQQVYERIHEEDGDRQEVSASALLITRRAEFSRVEFYPTR